MAGSNLTGTFIANTYQKLLQVDTDNGQNGVASFDSLLARTTTKYNLLNGLGQTLPYLVLDSTSNGNGGIWLKDNTNDGTNNAWGIQISNSDDSSDTPGLNFWRPFNSSNFGNYKLFLKNTGSAWVGYGGESNLPNDVANYSLYVRNGIQVGQNTTGNNGRINLIGANPLENGAGMFINGEHPFRIYRYSIQGGGDDAIFRTIIDETNNTFNVTDWTAMIVGIYTDHDEGGINEFRQIDDWRVICEPTNWSNGVWRLHVRYKLQGDQGISFPQIDVLVIKKGLYFDNRNTITALP